MGLARVLFLGLAGVFSRSALAVLLEAGVDVVGVVTPEGSLTVPIRRLPPPTAVSPLPILNPFAESTILELAWRQNIPVFQLRQPGHAQSLTVLAELGAKTAVVACYNQKIPPQLLALPRHGFLNIHPSLLPAYRGIAPLFWQLRAGETNTGVTVHWMDAGLDTGPILAQTAVPLPDGASGAELDKLLAETGAKLLCHHLPTLAAAPRRPQPPGGSAQPAPTAADFRLEPTWPAKRAFNFMRGTDDWGRPYPITISGKTWLLGTAVGFDEEGVQEEVVVVNGRDISIQFQFGSLSIQLR
ncbi:MAG: methionyl-tRNA formyltransferase [Anaerolineae bacterium]